MSKKAIFRTSYISAGHGEEWARLIKASPAEYWEAYLERKAGVLKLREKKVCGFACRDCMYEAASGEPLAIPIDRARFCPVKYLRCNSAMLVCNGPGNYVFRCLKEISVRCRIGTEQSAVCPEDALGEAQTRAVEERQERQEAYRIASPLLACVGAI